MRFRTFRAQAGRADEREGLAEILVAVFDVVDTTAAVGNTERQVIDRGAFSAWIAARERSSYPLFLDHGRAPITGYYEDALRIGKVGGAREASDGLLISAAYNLGTMAGQEAFERLTFDPEGAEFSFAWDPARERVEVRDGVQHAVELFPTEFSQVGMGAQALARLVAARSAGVATRELEELESPAMAMYRRLAAERRRRA